MRIVSGISLFCIIWTYSSRWPAVLPASAPDHDARPALERGLLEPCQAPEPPKKAAPKVTFLGVCRDG